MNTNTEKKTTAGEPFRICVRRVRDSRQDEQEVDGGRLHAGAPLTDQGSGAGEHGAEEQAGPVPGMREKKTLKTFKGKL